jgi:formylglycine-generating enzyme required for sulfatase activity
MSYFYSKNGQSPKPIDAASLERLIQGGDLGGNDLLWREGWEEWRALGQVEEFAQFLQGRRPATPPPLPGRTSDAIGLVASATQMRTFGEIEFVWCPPGTFVMGTPGDKDEEIPRQVTLTRGFWIGKYPVTQGQWLRVMGSNPSEFRSVGSDAPVENVSWDDAQIFCSLVSRANGIQCRLPTEAEWEYACRAGSTGRPYCFDSPYQGDLVDYAWYSKNSGETTHPVGQKKPNAWGLHDMHGNVWEWCADWYDKYTKGPATDPKGPRSGSYRVYRGGGWFNVAEICRSAYRLRYYPDSRSFNLGFRVAVSSTP